MAIYVAFFVMDEYFVLVVAVTQNPWVDGLCPNCFGQGCGRVNARGATLSLI